MKTLIIIFLLSICVWTFYPPIQDFFNEENKTVSEIEQEIFDLINGERAKYADIEVELPVLRVDEKLHNLAKALSEKMVATDIFEHSDHNLVENIFRAEGYTSDQIGSVCFEQWMLSPTHQANLLNKDITICGIAIAGNKSLWYATFIAK